MSRKKNQPEPDLFAYHPTEEEQAILNAVGSDTTPLSNNVWTNEDWKEYDRVTAEEEGQIRDF